MIQLWMDKEDMRMSSATIRDEFFEQYKEFYKGGPIPQHSSSDFAYFLECHRNRLEQKGIQAVKKIDQAAAKKIMHKNTAARMKSSLAKKVNA